MSTPLIRNPRIFKMLEEQHLVDALGVGLLEQDIACGIDSQGKDVKACYESTTNIFLSI